MMTNLWHACWRWHTEPSLQARKPLLIAVLGSGTCMHISQLVFMCVEVLETGRAAPWRGCVYGKLSFQFPLHACSLASWSSCMPESGRLDGWHACTCQKPEAQLSDVHMSVRELFFCWILPLEGDISRFTTLNEHHWTFRKTLDKNSCHYYYGLTIKTMALK